MGILICGFRDAHCSLCVCFRADHRQLLEALYREDSGVNRSFFPLACVEAAPDSSLLRPGQFSSSAGKCPGRGGPISAMYPWRSSDGTAFSLTL